MFSDEHLYAIALRRCSQIGDLNFKRLVSAEGSAVEVWKRPQKNLMKTFGIGLKAVAEIGDDQHLKFAEKELSFCEKNNIHILLSHCGDLPYLLNQCEDAPAVLYMKGQLPDKLPLSIVGTRNMTAYGRHFVAELLEHARGSQIITVSGLALGTDSEVHQQSIEKDIPTIAVLAHGFHTMYPSKNRNLAAKILEHGGALLTEFNSSQKPDRENFIQRNRIIAGMSRATIVVETAFGGGSVSTVTFANQYNRDVFALPGKISDKYSQGCNQLIYNNKAGAVSTIADLLADLKLSGVATSGELFPYSETRPMLSTDEETLLGIIRGHPNINLDDLAEKAELPTYRILPILLELELKSYLKSFSGRQFLAV